MKTVYLALGANLGDRRIALQTAVEKLHRADLRIKRLSDIFETEPLELRNQPEFYNAVLEADTTLLPLRLLQRILRVEREMGRKRLVPKGPRTIDIDVLLYGSSVIDTPRLQVPHPRMLDRRFVLEPLAELAPDLRHPVTKRKIHEHLAAVASQRVQRTGLFLQLPA